MFIPSLGNSKPTSNPKAITPQNGGNESFSKRGTLNMVESTKNEDKSPGVLTNIINSPRIKQINDDSHNYMSNKSRDNSFLIKREGETESDHLGTQ